MKNSNLIDLDMGVITHKFDQPAFQISRFDRVLT